MWYSSIIKKNYPQWKIKSTLYENNHEAVYEIEEKDLGDGTGYGLKILSLSEIQASYLKRGEHLGWSESLLRQYFKEALQEYQQDLRQRSQYRNSPFLLPIYDTLLMQEEDSSHYVLLRRELLPSLEEILSKEKLKPEQIQRLSENLAEALEEVKDRGFLQGALRLDNIFLTPSGEFKLGEMSFFSYLKRKFPREFLGVEGQDKQEKSFPSLESLVELLTSEYTSLDRLSPLAEEEVFSDQAISPKGQKEEDVHFFQESSPYEGSREQINVSPALKRDPPSQKKSAKVPLLILGALAAFIVLGILAAILTFGNREKGKEVDLAKIPQIQDRNFIAVEEGEKLKLKLFDGTQVDGIYYGEMKGGKPHGQGAFTSSDQSNLWTYSGGWENGLFEGQGKYVAKNDGYYYEGGLHQGKAHGRGISSFPNKDSYEGEFKDDHFHGKGVQTWEDGSRYKGDFVQGIRKGVGTYTWASGDVYEGDYDNDLPNGKGKFTFANGTVYEGDFVNNEFHGKGKMSFQDGGIYQGDFEKNVFHGMGIYTWPTGEVYEGMWKDDLQNGQGKIRYADGAHYEGNMLNDQRSGQGSMTWANGDRYRGDWEKDTPSGKGEFHWSDGSSYVGDVADGSSEGRGIKKYANGDSYEGEWSKGERHGQGTYTWADGSVYTGQFSLGKLHGEGVLTDAQGNVVKKGTWDQDEFIGQ